MNRVITPNTLLEYAKYYCELGWCVIPLPQGTKKAKLKWRRYQSDRPDVSSIQKWFGCDNQNIAVVLGSVSGNLVCLDFDDADAYDRWARHHCDFANRLPTVRTARGFHVYVISCFEGIKHVEFGEIRGKGGYCVLPPSLHPDHKTYTWITEPTAENLVRIDDIGLLLNVTERAEENRGELKRLCVGGELSRIINETLPALHGTRHVKIFELARRIKSVPQHTDANPHQLRAVVLEWHRRAVDNIRTKEFEETWIDFLKGWPKIKYKIGEEPMAQVFQKTLSMEAPIVAMRQYPDNPNMQLLVGLCRELQRASGDGPFFLACRTAGQLLGISAMTASRWFFLLEEDGILETVEKGNTKGNKATRFKYLCRLED